MALLPFRPVDYVHLGVLVSAVKNANTEDWPYAVVEQLSHSEQHLLEQYPEVRCLVHAVLCRRRVLQNVSVEEQLTNLYGVLPDPAIAVLVDLAKIHLPIASPPPESFDGKQVAGLIWAVSLHVQQLILASTERLTKRSSEITIDVSNFPGLQ